MPIRDENSTLQRLRDISASSSQCWPSAFSDDLKFGKDLQVHLTRISSGRNGSLATLPTVFSSACRFGLLLLEAGASTAGQLQMLQRFLELKICFLSLPPTGLCSASWDHIECLFLFFLSIFVDGYHLVPKSILVKTHILSVSTIPSVKLFPDFLPSWPHNSEYSLVYQSSC